MYKSFWKKELNKISLQKFSNISDFTLNIFENVGLPQNSKIEEIQKRVLTLLGVPKVFLENPRPLFYFLNNVTVKTNQFGDFLAFATCNKFEFDVLLKISTDEVYGFLENQPERLLYFINSNLLNFLEFMTVITQDDLRVAQLLFNLDNNNEDFENEERKQNIKIRKKFLTADKRAMEIDNSFWREYLEYRFIEY
jgi:hypothetical protein